MLTNTRLIGLVCWSLLCATTTAAAQQQDPTKPPAAVLAQLTSANTYNNDIVLSAVFTRGQQRYAVVNKRIMRIGDDISGKKLVSINAQSIKLRDLLNNEPDNEDLVVTIHNQTNTVGNMVKRVMK